MIYISINIYYYTFTEKNRQIKRSQLWRSRQKSKIRRRQKLQNLLSANKEGEQIKQNEPQQNSQQEQPQKEQPQQKQPQQEQPQQEQP